VTVRVGNQSTRPPRLAVLRPAGSSLVIKFAVLRKEMPVRSKRRPSSCFWDSKSPLKRLVSSLSSVTSLPCRHVRPNPGTSGSGKSAAGNSGEREEGDPENIEVEGSEASQIHALPVSSTSSIFNFGKSIPPFGLMIGVRGEARKPAGNNPRSLICSGSCFRELSS